MTPDEIEAFVLGQARAYQAASNCHKLGPDEKYVLRQIPFVMTPSWAYATHAILSYYAAPLTWQ